MDNMDRYIGTMLDGRYEILSVLGEGGMAVVYKALCHRLNRYDAVKIMRDDMATDEEFRSRFCAEAHAVAMLSHPNIVAVYDVSHNDAIEYIVMELVDGITMRQYMDKRGALAVNETVHFVKQMAKALGHAHERGIIHRDVKPQNVMVLRDGTIKIADFGIAALENEIYENKGMAVGSIHYIAPEQARGEMPDARSDIYSLGVVMYEMLTGHKPYEGDSIAEIAVKHMNAEPDPMKLYVPDIPPELERITLKAMCAPISRRYQSAAELLSELDAFTQAQAKQSEKDGQAEHEDMEHPPVVPVRSVSELDKERYALRKRRASRVSFLTGVFGSLCLCVALLVFLWDFWLGEIFSPAERLKLPNFVGYDYQSVVENAEYAATYSFEVVYSVDTGTRAGTIIAQNPVADRSMMLTPDGIHVELTVSTGMVFVPVPDVTNIDYREAKNRLQQAGFVVEIENATSSAVSKDCVISTSPTANEQLSSGSTVYLTVSSGPQISKIEVPNLIGLTEDAAISRLESIGLSHGGSDRVHSELEPGTVIGQSIPAFSEIEEHSKIQLKVSSGPDEYR